MKEIEKIKEEWNKRCNYIKESKNVDTEEIFNFFKPYLSLQSSKGISDEEINNQDFTPSEEFQKLGNNEKILVRSGFNAGAKWMRSKLSEGSKTNGWVDVKDRLPEGTWTKHEWQKHLSQDVLFRNDVAMFIGRWNRENYWWETGAPVKGNWVDDVTHWMPLPSPPNELSNQTDAVECRNAEEFVKHHFKGIEKETWYPAIVAIAKGYAEESCIGFATWIKKEGYIKSSEFETAWNKSNDHIHYGTQELYLIFQNEKDER